MFSTKDAASTSAPQVDGTAFVRLQGEFLMGTNAPVRNQRDGDDPVYRLTVSLFSIATTTVTNGEFAGRGSLEQTLFPWGDELTPGSTCATSGRATSQTSTPSRLGTERQPPVAEGETLTAFHRDVSDRSEPAQTCG